MAARLYILASVAALNAFGQKDPETPGHDVPMEQIQKLHAKIDSSKDGHFNLDELMEFERKMFKHIQAQDVQHPFEERDANKDGQLSLDELMKYTTSQFEGVDEAEMKELEPRKQLESLQFKAADKDNDGILRGQEIVAFFSPATDETVLAITVEASMLQKDKDKDGKLTLHELYELTEASVPGDDAESPLHEEFSTLDTNGDGSVDMAELKKWESGRFHVDGLLMQFMQDADKDGDKQVSTQELEAAHEPVANHIRYHFSDWIEYMDEL
jgi:Ca2+-binding EF-hand superfamily protein